MRGGGYKGGGADLGACGSCAREPEAEMLSLVRGPQPEALHWLGARRPCPPVLLASAMSGWCHGHGQHHRCRGRDLQTAL